MRHLAYFAAGFSTAVFFCHYEVGWPIWLGLWGCLTAAVLLRFPDRRRRRAALLLLSMGMVLGIARYGLQAELKLTSRRDLEGISLNMSGTVTGYPQAYDQYVSVAISAETRDGSRKTGLFYAYEGQAAELRPGDRVIMSVRLSPIGEAETDYPAKGYYLRGTLESVTVTGRVPLAELRYGPAHLAHRLQLTMDRYLPPESAAFMKALVTGQQKDLYAAHELHRALSEAGLAHVVAVSGMHVGFFVALSLLLLGAHRGWKLALVLMGLFAFMTGLSPSVLRALFMQSVFLLGPVLRREPDGLTSIMGALLILLLLNPFAAGSLSLQLSFLAVFGLVVLTPRMMGWFQKKGEQLHGTQRKVYVLVTSSLSTSLGATAFSSCLAALKFGRIALLAPLSNLLILWMIPVCFAGGFLLFAFSWLQPVAALLGKLLHAVICCIVYLAKGVAALPMATVCLPPKLTLLWFLGAYVLFGLAYGAKKKNALFRPLAPICGCALLLFSLLLGVRGYYRLGTTLAAVDVGQGQCIVLLDGDRTLMVDCGGRYDAGDRIVQWLESHGRRKVDVLVLSHFDADHVNAVPELLQQIPVGQMLSGGTGLQPNEAEQFHAIQLLAREKAVHTAHLSESVEFTLGDLRVICYTLPEAQGNRGIAVLASAGEQDILITGDMSIEDEYDLLCADRFPDGEYLVAGHHGSKYSTGTLLLDEFQPEEVIISCGKNHFGHPSSEVLHRLCARNMVVYRTDLLGNVELKVR